MPTFLEEITCKCATDPEFRAAYDEAMTRMDRLIERDCSEGNCVELIDPETNENLGGWGPSGCPCQDEDDA